MTTNLGTTALSLAAFGWPVFPCLPGSKEPCTDHGYQDATTDLKQVARWWKRWSDANIGLATGGNGPGVLDFDQQKPKTAPVEEGFELLKMAGLLKGAGPIVRTRSGGYHIYFLGGTHGNAAYIGGYPIDYRGVGGYVITAPSIVEGGLYEVVNSRPATAEFNVDSAKLLLSPPPKEEVKDYASKNFDGSDVAALVRFVNASEKGERHPRVFWALVKAAENGNQEPVIEAAIETLGFDERDIRRQAANAKRIAGK